jgi:hypothetical protein
MYNGGNGNGGNQRYRDVGSNYSTSTQEPGGIRVGGVQIKPLYLYIAAGVALLIALFFVARLLDTALIMHFSAAAGVLLLLANVRELMGRSYGQANNTALLNTMIGGALLFGWLSQLAGVLFWIPAVLLLLAAAPLALGRASIYQSYVSTARGAVDQVRRATSRRN